MLTTAEGAYCKLCSKEPNAKMVPINTIAPIEITSVGVIFGAPTQTGWYRLNRTPAIRVPQPKTTTGEFSATMCRGNTTYNAAVTPERIPHTSASIGIANSWILPFVMARKTPSNEIPKAIKSVRIGNSRLKTNVPRTINNGLKYCKIVAAAAVPRSILM